MEEYPLATLMQIREQERDQAEQRYAETLRDFEQLQKEVKSAEARVQDASDRLQKARAEARQARESSQVMMTDIGLHRAYEKALKDDVEAAKSAVQVATAAAEDFQKKVVQKALKDFQEAQKGVMAVEKHYENWKAERQLERDRKASDQMDEIAIRGWSKS